MVEIRIRKVGKDLFGALEGMGPFTPEDELRAHGESVVIGAYAWVEYLRGSERGRAVRQRLEDPNVRAYACALTIAEVVSKAARSGKDPDVAYSAIVLNSRVIEVDAGASRLAGLKHAEMRRTVKDFGLVDAYLLVYGGSLRARVLAGDPHLRGVPNALFLG